MTSYFLFHTPGTDVHALVELQSEVALVFSKNDFTAQKLSDWLKTNLPKDVVKSLIEELSK